MKEFLRAAKFTIISLSAGLIQIAAFSLCRKVLHWESWLSYLIGLVLSVVWNFILNRKYTFQSAVNVREAMLKVAAFYAVFTPFSTWLEKVLTQAGWNDYLVTGLNMVLNLILEFLYQRFFVFNKNLDDQK